MSDVARRKGRQGEQAVARVFTDVGARIEQLQRNREGHADLIVNDHLYVDVKRQERLRIPEWIKQAERQTPAGATPVVAFRQNAGAWWACLPLDVLAELMR